MQLQNGHLDKRVSEQYYDPVGERFLPDRYIEGTCPHCGFGAARGDQCEHCSTTLDATDLIEPRSKISGAVPELRPTEHFYFRYSDFTDKLSAWLETRQGWRPHVLNFCFGWTNEGCRTGPSPVTWTGEWSFPSTTWARGSASTSGTTR